MDRTSRFQNPISGGFNKPPPIQNEGVVGVKPLQPLILDRFRALVKEREEELKVFGGGVPLPLSTDEIVRLYEIVLSELTVNSKPIITDLTIIAGEQREHGDGIADAICARIIEVPFEQKLPSLYLLDSIVKNIGKEYIRYFSTRLPEVFCEAYAQVHPSMHPAMRHLFGTWSTVFPLPVLQAIESKLQFSPSVNSHSRASESPRPTRGIHINPKYLEAQRHFGPIDPGGSEGLGSVGRTEYTSSALDALKKPYPPASRITRPSSPYKIGHVGSFSPLLDEFDIDGSPNRNALRASPPRPGISLGLNRVMGKDQYPKTSVAHKYSDDVDLSGPRALISAYGMDEREKNLKRKHPTDSNGVADKKAPMRSWQNTEEEEFDWEDMNPALPPSGKLMAKPGVAANHTVRLRPDYRGDLSKARLSSSPGRESISKTGGFLPNATGPSDLMNQTLPTLVRDSLIFPPQQYQRNLNTEAGPANYESSHIQTSLSSLSQLGMNNSSSSGIDQGMNNILHNEQHFSSTGSMPQVNPPQMLGQRPPINVQRISQPSQVLPNPLLAQGSRQNLSLPSAIPTPSNQMGQSINYGYLAQGQGLPIGAASSNLIPSAQPSMPMFNAPNMPFNMQGGTLHSLPRGPFPASAQALPIGQNTPNPAAGSALTGLISSLMAQGLISANKQDSVGVEFDQDMLKVRHESTITALYADLPRQCKTCGRRFQSQEEHSKHMDWHVSKNRTLRNRKTKPPPKYFVNVSMWLRGAEAVGTEAGPGFLPPENAVEEKKDEEEMSVPADEDQHACALCGEPFEDFYSDEMEEWMYKGAVYMYAPPGSTAGMDRSQLGPIVHIKCRSDSHELPSELSEKDKGESAEQDSRRKILRS